jgi:hypothetical protein
MVLASAPSLAIELFSVCVLHHPIPSIVIITTTTIIITITIIIVIINHYQNGSKTCAEM